MPLRDKVLIKGIVLNVKSKEKLMKKIVSISIIVVLLCLGCAGVIVGVVRLSDDSPEAYSDAYCNSYLNEGDLFHDQACEYISEISPSSENNLVLRLKAKHGAVKTAEILYTFDYNGVNQTYHQAQMTFENVDNTGYYDYWIGTIPANEAPYNYKFLVQNNVDKVYYNRDGLSVEEPTSTSGDWAIYPNFSTPSWSQGTIWYSIMPESFYNFNTLNDKTGVNGGEKLDYETVWGGHNSSAGEWFGGDLSGITYKEDYLANVLMIESLFVNPFWITNHNAGYGCYDFYQIDSALGNDVELLKLVSELHEDELKIMLDAVFEYCNVNNILYNITQRYPDLVKDSFYNFVQRDESGNVNESVWSGGLIDFSNQITRETIYTEEESIMLTYIITFGIDAWRMDVGNTLSGSRADNWEDATQILQDIRPYLKEVSDEILFLSEHADTNQLTDGILDSKWNYNFQKAVLSWCNNTSNASILSTALSDAVFGSFTRGVSNSLYNFLTSHDTASFYEEIGYDKTSYMSAYLLMMTYVGSPCVYFNEETGSVSTKLTDLGTMSNSFYTSMNWDSSSYDYDIYNFIKALCTVRNAFKDEYRTGGFMNLYSEYVDNPNDIYAYARFADNVCITVLNRNASTVENFTLSVDKLNLKDGSKLYDYFSGKVYTVSGQKIEFDILPVGTILTDKPIDNKYVAMLESVSGVDDNSTVTADGNGIFTLEGDGNILSRFVYRPGFNNYSASAKSISLDGNSEYALLIRDGNDVLSDAYGVIVKEKSLQSVIIKDGKTSLGGMVSYNKGAVVKISRTNDNKFITTVDGKIVEEFTALLEFDYYVYLGFAPIRGNSKIDFKVEQESEQISSDFSTSLGSQFFIEGNKEAVSLESGKLLMSSKESTFVLTRAHVGDFTAQITIDEIGGSGIGGLVVYQSKNDYILLGKYDGTYVLAHVINGLVSVYAQSTIDVKALQIEKTGSHYRGLAITDNGVEEIGEYNVGYSEIFVGIACVDSFLQIDSFVIGDGADNVKNYLSEGPINFSSDEYMESSLELKYVIGKGNGFTYERGYVYQTESDGYTLYALSDMVTNFTSTFTLVPKSFGLNDSYIGVTFDASAVSVVDGYTFRIYSDGKLTLNAPDGSVLDENKMEIECDQKYQFILRVRDNYVYVYDPDNTLILSYDKRSPMNGYTAYTSYAATYMLGSYNTYKPTGNYASHNGTFYVIEKGDNTKLELSSDNDVNYVSMRNIGLNDLALGFNLQLNRINAIARGNFVLSIGKNAGDYYLGGLSVKFDDRGRISIYEDGEEIIKNQQTTIANISSVYLVVCYVDGVLTIDKIDYNDANAYNVDMYERIFTYQSSRLYRGVLSFYSKNAGVKLNSLRGWAINGDVDIKTLELYTRIALDEPIPANPDVSTEPVSEEYTNDFDGNSSLAQLNRYNGQIYIDEGNLIIDASTTLNWDAGAALATGVYQNFTASFKVKADNNLYGGGFAAFEFYKSAPDINHQSSALTITIWHSGDVGLFVGNDMLTSYGFTATKDDEGYVEISVTVNNGVITVSSGSQGFSVRIADLPNNSELTSGYVSLNAGANTAYFDWFSIKPI